MTHGTSAHAGSLSRVWADAGQDRAGQDWQIDWQRIAQAATAQLPLLVSAMAGLATGLTLTAAWQAATDMGAQLAILLAAGAALACIALRPRNRAMPAPQEQRAVEEPGRLLAQMHHELRTPLNAVIGFSDLMVRELHGPLGNARYQEYAAHISESGGRLLKASEDTLAVAATMSALLADPRTLRCERLCAARLVRQAWAALGEATHSVRLRMEDRAGVEIDCDGRAARQAVQHLLAEAVACAAPGGTVVARSGTEGSQPSLEIAVEPSASAPSCRSARPDGSAPNGDGLRLTLARSLIEMQGATLNLGRKSQADRWSVRIAFAATSARPTLRRRRGSTAAAAARLPTTPARPEDFVAAAAAHASAETRAVPPA